MNVRVNVRMSKIMLTALSNPGIVDPICCFHGWVISKKSYNATTVKVLSDGPSNQFKNKYFIGSYVVATVKKGAGQKILTRQ